MKEWSRKTPWLRDIASLLHQQHSFEVGWKTIDAFRVWLLRNKQVVSSRLGSSRFGSSRFVQPGGTPAPACGLFERQFKSRADIGRGVHP